MNPRKYNFAMNDPFDMDADIKLVLPKMMSSINFMKSIKRFEVNKNSIAIWTLGQNGFIIKDNDGTLICIDPYLSNYCEETRNQKKIKFKLDRQLPIFIEPEDLDVDIILITHSHDDHADPYTLPKVKNDPLFIGPWEAIQKLKSFGIDEKNCKLIHPAQEIEAQGINIFGTFSLPTDLTDLNHIGFVIKFKNNITFYNSGDTNYTNLLGYAGKFNPDIATLCINGGYNNLDVMEAVQITNLIKPKVIIPCHYDMMINNTGNPLVFESFLNLENSQSEFHLMNYYEPFIYEK
jgi:L-ascorbate 6-phosphate lactonase